MDYIFVKLKLYKPLVHLTLFAHSFILQHLRKEEEMSSVIPITTTTITTTTATTKGVVIFGVFKHRFALDYYYDL